MTRRLFTVVKYLGFLKNLGGISNPVMPLLIILCCLFRPAFVHWSRQRPQHPGMICQHLTKMMCFFAQSLAALLSCQPPVRIKISVIISKLASKNLQSKWSQMICAAENSTVATEAKKKKKSNPFELQKRPPVCLLVCPTHPLTLRRSFEVEYLCMKMEMTKNITNTTTSKKNKNKNLYTLHVLIKVTEPVRFLDSSWIQQQILFSINIDVQYINVCFGPGSTQTWEGGEGVWGSHCGQVSQVALRGE